MKSAPLEIILQCLYLIITLDFLKASSRCDIPIGTLTPPKQIKTKQNKRKQHVQIPFLNCMGFMGMYPSEFQLREKIT